MFGWLCRLDARSHQQRKHNKQRNDEGRLLHAVQGICAWTCAALGRTTGYDRFSSVLLWGWACNDAFWALTLAKGVLSIRHDDAEDSNVLVPSDLADLQRMMLHAVLGLACSSVAFSFETLSDDKSIFARTAELVRHRAELAIALQSCQLVQELIWATARVGVEAGSHFAAFLAALLQLELDREAGWIASSDFARDANQQSKQASADLGEFLQRFRWDIWNIIADAPLGCGGTLARGFLQDCANLAYVCPPVEQSGQKFLSNCLVCNCTRGVAADDAFSLAALCIFAANSELPCDARPLKEAFVGVSYTGAELVFDQWAGWRGPVRTDALKHWAMALTNAPSPELPVQPPEIVSDSSATTPTAGRRNILRGMLHDIPAQFRCALDGQLMMDPVCSPQGNYFERVVLSSALDANGGHCPITAQVLSLEDCPRVPELRRKIAQWVRQQHISQRGAG